MAKATNPTFFQRYKGWIIAGIILLVILILVSWFVGAYNGLVATRQNVDSKWGTVETQYQRRTDLVPQLVATVSGSAKFEKSVLTEITDARAKVGQVQLTTSDLSDPAKIKAFQDAQTQLSGALSRLIAVAESYPDIKTTQNFLALQGQLEGTENRIAVARKDYNDAVQVYNTLAQTIPTNIVAAMSGFTQRAYFQADTGANKAPVVAFP